ncbi:KH domain-containing protein [Roridomyces roridus]|uniref:KH domain-containing protein n=1 Tax=Roridomyces roridus TaxID=1738132 RepID=A0AAD7FH73_9AGAR|nr:KH domain-containing protein [Roridomyces roridus]
MSSKRKWDQAAPEAANEGPEPKKLELSLDAQEAAARAAAIASKIAAQFGDLAAEEAFSQDVDINDVRNRYMLTKASTQQEIRQEAGGSLSTKGTWYPDRTKATERDPPLYLHVTARSAEILKKTIDTINEYIAIDMGSLVEDKKKEKRKWPEEKLPVGLESIRNFNIRAKVVGPSGSFVKYIQQETQTRVQIKGIGSGFVDQETGRESDEPLYIHITGPEEGQVARAKVLTEDLLLVVRSEHAKVATAAQHEQMELRQAQMQYAAYTAMSSGYQAPPPPSGAPPPAPGEQPPPPPDGSDPSAQTSPEAYAAYWAAYGYDVNSDQFKEWAAQQQQQYSQYYAQGGSAPGADGAAAPPAPAQPAPPPPDAPASQPPPPPPPA